VGNLTSGMQSLLSGAAVSMSPLRPFFTRAPASHSARFARIGELEELLSATPDREPSLLLGMRPFGNMLRVRPHRARRELGNLLVVAPTRDGKTSLPSASFSPGAIQQSSTTSREISSARLPATDRPSALFSSSIRPVSATAMTFRDASQRTSSSQAPPIFFTNPMRGTGRSSSKEQPSC
jgi:hypothetical protein